VPNKSKIRTLKGVKEYKVHGPSFGGCATKEENWARRGGGYGGPSLCHSFS